MTRTIPLTMTQALARFLTRQMTMVDGRKVPLFAGVWAIFGHGNVAGMGEALYGVRDTLPTYRAHNEQAMAHAAVAYAKATRRRRMMACTTSIGPGALNMVTAAAVAHVDRLPVLFLPGDIFANRKPDPVLQQIENFGDGTASANDCFRPVSRYFDRIARPEQLIPALHRAMQVLTDPAECGPVTLALCQDVQAEAFDYPESFFAETVWSPRRIRPDESELTRAVSALRAAKKPVIISGGGVLYSEASAALAGFAERHGIPVTETQAGKSSLPFLHPLNMGAIGVTGTSASNRLAEEADVILAVGTRLQDFTTGSWALFKNPDKTIIGLNAQGFDAGKHRALPLIADARVGIDELSANLGSYKAPAAWTKAAQDGFKAWMKEADAVTAASNALPSDAQVIGAVQRALGRDISLLCAAGGLPGELHKLWQASTPSSYHLEYGFSCMGYEIAGGLGMKLAQPEREVVVMVGDGSYLMLNSEVATSVMMGVKLTIVLLDNRGYGCITRLQKATGGARFNNLLADSVHETLPEIDFAAHARSMGADAQKVSSLADLETALAAAKTNKRTTVIVIDTDPWISTEAGGHWWDVAVPEVSSRKEVDAARKKYETAVKQQRVGD
ncbi:3D-(3,5/4)-trihydroxycyclohexane-1,2-dione acylhydrolase (decyclizing) [Nordella sp. HKS 07]|uniref:3D-(3,5/4)-trihydroxycyclohexane-1,2-dione acylhydrolase (decyclizing) n=1 Tax=Nordella sp. HKS 07 TaxID=2712222 RepID=UPI0013E1BB87|nr:3D-(3,5/4)-trihydroxycyclohexane-1,2-dione acylhydrolase (decyclizing) [Nordella sp. HKS 07]QIG47901.1 3D-(3,5/4)-trihydroxycyclohexane-1,2-dione acylhydrolase (decyclizing) [Nordella sp. HKS 07]